MLENNFKCKNLRALLVFFCILAFKLDANALPLKAGQSFKSESKKFSRIISINGKGTFRIKLTERKINPNFRVYKNGVKTVSPNVVIYRGTISGKNFSEKIAAAKIKNNIFAANFILPVNEKFKYFRISENTAGEKKLIGQNAASLKIPCSEEIQLNADSAFAASHKSSSNSLKSIKISIDLDAYWYRLFGDISAEIALAQLNEAEVLFKRQFDLEFKYQDISIWTNSILNPDGTELSQYRNFKLTDSNTKPADVYYLLSGKSLSSGAIGVAYLASICRSKGFAFGISTFTTPLLSPITIAHEIGHNLGAQHDYSEEETVMSPVLGAQLKDIKFSDYSQYQINAFVSSYGTCLEDTIGINSETSDEINLAANLSADGVFAINLENIAPGCSINIKVKRAAKRYRYTPLMSILPEQSSKTIISLLEYKFKGKLKLKAFQSCSGINTVSNVATIKGRGRTKLTKKYFRKIRNNLVANLL